MFRFDLTNYLTKAVIGFSAFSAYDVFIEGRDFGGFATSDAAAYTLALISAEWAADLLNSLIDVNGNSLSGMLTRPLLTGVIYMYLYDYMVRPSYNSSRTNNNLIIMGSLSCVLLNYASNPILSLFGLKNY